MSNKVRNSVNDPIASIIACLVLKLATNHNQHKVFTQDMFFYFSGSRNYKQCTRFTKEDYRSG